MRRDLKPPPLFSAVVDHASERWGNALIREPLGWGRASEWGGERISANDAGPALVLFLSDPDRVQIRVDVPGSPLIEHSAEPTADEERAAVATVLELLEAAASGPFRLRGLRLGHVETRVWPERFVPGRGFVAAGPWSTLGLRFYDTTALPLLAVEWPERAPDARAVRADPVEIPRIAIEAAAQTLAADCRCACGKVSQITSYGWGHVAWFYPAPKLAVVDVGPDATPRRTPRQWLGRSTRAGLDLDVFGANGAVEFAWLRAV